MFPVFSVLPVHFYFLTTRPRALYDVLKQEDDPRPVGWYRLGTDEPASPADKRLIGLAFAEHDARQKLDAITRENAAEYEAWLDSLEQLK